MKVKVDITALRRLFSRHVKFEDLTRAYRQVFETTSALNYVLPDLADYSGVDEPLPTDPAQAQRMAGRQDMLLRIRHFVDLTANDIYTLQQGNGTTRRRIE